MTTEESKLTFGYTGPPAVLHNAMEARITELESENMRLQRLVAELLLKNQQLRRQEA